MLMKILFEFHHFFNLQNVIKSQIHFNTTSTGPGGLIFSGCIFFCLQVDSSDRSKGGARGVCPPPPPPPPHHHHIFIVHIRVCVV